MSGLGNKVKLEAKPGQIIISKASNPRQDWDKQIKSLIAQDDPSAEFGDLAMTANDGLEALPWDGPTFEEWQKANAKIS